MLKAAALVFALLPLAAFAAPIGDPQSQCNLAVGVGFTAQQKIAACGTAIKAGQLEGMALARAFAGRGSGRLFAGQAALALRDLDDAVAQARAADPQSAFLPAIIDERGYVYLQLARPARALRDFEAVLRLTPGFAEVYLGRAEALNQLHLAAAALADAERAVAASPGLADGYMARGEAHYVMGAFTKAIPDFDMAIQIDPTRYEFWAGRGQSYTATARFALAIHDLEQALRLKPGDTEVRTALDLAKSAEAERAARIATAPPVDLTADAPSRPISQTHDCTLLDKVHAIYETGTVQIVYDVAPDGTMADVLIAHSSGSPGLDQSGVDCVSQLWRNLPEVKGGAAMASPGHRVDIAFSFDVDASEGPAKAPDYQCQQAAARGRYDDAVAACTQAIALDPRSADYLEHRGLAWYVRGQLQSALADFEAALRLEPTRTGAADARDLAKEMIAAAAPRSHGDPGI